MKEKLKHHNRIKSVEEQSLIVDYLDSSFGIRLTDSRKSKLQAFKELNFFNSLDTFQEITPDLDLPFFGNPVRKKTYSVSQSIFPDIKPVVPKWTLSFEKHLRSRDHQAENSVLTDDLTDVLTDSIFSGSLSSSRLFFYDLDQEVSFTNFLTDLHMKTDVDDYFLTSISIKKEFSLSSFVKDDYINPLKKWFFSSKNNSREISKAEILGRFIYSGFELLEFKEVSGRLYVLVKKVFTKVGSCKNEGRSVLKLPRVAKGGKVIEIYKFRSMYPYSQYLQDFLLERNDFSQDGKIINDFRITRMGKFLRRYWLDELPQIINLIKGDLKLFGIRPISISFFNSLPLEMKKIRSSQKPGCIPPYIAFRKNLNRMEVLQSEIEYLDKSESKGLTYDLKLSLIAIYNILFRGVRSV
jgi:lipopolysaccharide/colanic/teichoic acid biosynthesis glycosyltransferase